MSSNSNRFVCIHGHFYQPPRENPWTGEIDPQETAHPYPDWNRRIHAECYAPNTEARILDDAGRTARRVDNYSRISFNFGPTLLTWLETAEPETYRRILAADEASRRNYSGHGSAIAQAYNHAILPLCNARDKRTQVIWGIRDFTARFGREPEGLWLPETAVDTESLEVLAANGIRFTILAPRQARRVRRIGSAIWRDVSSGTIDPRHPYRVLLPSGRSIDLFFYHGAISQAVAFERLLSSGAAFADRLLGAFDDEDDAPQLVHIATDGETYGHHHAHGDMALAFALENFAADTRARLTNYGEYLDRFPPTHEVEIDERTSWSCAHGLGRWSIDCGCARDPATGRNQRWRAPLREALDGLRDALAPRFERLALRYFTDPWAARDDSIELILGADDARSEEFFRRHSRVMLTRGERETAIELLELQRYTMLIYTSCAWFFDELSRIETVQILRYACRALQLSEKLFGESLEPEFLERLALAPSNLPEVGDGKRLYEQKVRSKRPPTQLPVEDRGRR